MGADRGIDRWTDREISEPTHTDRQRNRQTDNTLL